MVALLVHLTSEAIEVSLLRVVKGQKTKVFLSRSLPLHNDLAGYVRDAHSLLSKTREKIDEVVCVFGPTFAKQKTRIIPHSEKSPIKIDKNFLNKLTANSEDGHRIEDEILSTKMNGYITTNPIGKETSDFEIVAYQSSVSEETINEIRASMLHISKKMHFQTSPYVAYKVLSSLRQNSKPFIILEIERDVSTFSLVNGNNFFETSSIGKGTGFILSSVEEKLNVDEKVAKSIIQMMEEKTLDDKTRDKLDTAIKESMEKWIEEANRGLSELGGGLPLPGDVYLIAPHQWNDYFKAKLTENNQSNFTYEKDGFNLDISDFKDIYQNVSFETIPENPLLLLMDVLFIEKNLIQ